MRINHFVFFSGGTERTLVWQDAHFQYLDFFAWMKDLLSGEQSVFYTFNCSLGQGGIGLFTYYLSSPFNLLLLFFDKTELHRFFHLALALKLACCGAAMGVFLQRRYRTLRFGYGLLLSVSYGLCQYVLSQGSNIMWIDGVYMLPLILLGVYLVREKKDLRLLSISVALSVLFNWYTGGINCLAAGMYFCAEYLMDIAGRKTDEENVRKKDGNSCILRNFLREFLPFLASMCIGLMLSAFLFLPTVWSLLQGKGSSFDLDMLRPGFTGNLLSSIPAYSLGEISELGYPALFCGTPVLIGCLGVLTLKTLSKREKLAAGFICLVTLYIFYWKPLFLVFSLFKNAESYYYRYAYVASAIFIAMAGRFFADIASADGGKLLKLCAGFMLISLVMDYAVPHEQPGLYQVGLQLSAVTMLLSWAVVRRSGREAGENAGESAGEAGESAVAAASGHRFDKLCTTLCTVALLGVWCLELVMNTHYTLQCFACSNAETFRQYNHDQMELVDMVKNLDGGTYRISQTMTREMNFQHTTATLDESMAFNYMSVENYTSFTQTRQMAMLEKFGYTTYNDCLLAKNAFLLPVDTLMSVKYLLSPYPVKGLEPAEIQEERNGKRVYRNPYAVPIAFTAADSLKDSIFLKKEGGEAENSFEYWNQAYAALTGNNAPIMERLEYTEVREPQKITYTIQVPAGRYAVYGDIPTSEDLAARVFLNGRFSIPYSTWLAVHAFYVPGAEYEDQKAEEQGPENQGPENQEAEPTSMVVTFVTNKPIPNDVIEDVRFYALNLDAFEERTALLQKGAAEEVRIEKDHASIDKTGKEGELLFTSIPYDAGWKITRNGVPVKPELFEDCLICLPMEEGKNHFEFQYKVPWMKAGAVMSVMGAVVLAAAAVYGARNH